MPHQLCRHCLSLTIERYFQDETRTTNVGPVQRFTDASCPFCTLIRESIASYRRFNWPEFGQAHVELYMWSRSWWYSNPQRRRMRHAPHLFLATDHIPREIQNTEFRTETNRDGRKWIILLELELLPESRLAQKVTFTEPSVFFLRRDMGPHADTTLIKRWIDTCKGHVHSRMTTDVPVEDDLFYHKDGFRLIDVVDNCLVQRKSYCEYAALSYVWGGRSSSTLKCTEENVSQLYRKQALTPESLAEASRKEVALTIRHAMEFVRRIGLRFLWVDAICIIQNDGHEKKRLIHGMDRVYERAVLTIVAAAGSNADEGLFRTESGGQTLYERLTPICFPSSPLVLRIAVSPPPLVDQLERSRWAARGWTYQEQCLSQRCLYFTPFEVFFVCKERQWREGYCLEHLDKEYLTHGPAVWSSHDTSKEDPGPSPYLCLSDGERNRSFAEYQTAVRSYTRKELSLPQDILNAFAGIFRKFSSTREVGTTQGLPCDYFPDVLLWYPTEGGARVSHLENNPSCFRSSWSWSSWKGPIDFLPSDYPSSRPVSWHTKWAFTTKWYCQGSGREASFDVQPFGTLSQTDIKTYLDLPFDLNAVQVERSMASFRKPREADNGPPPDFMAATGELCFWAPVLRFRSQVECPASDGRVNLGNGYSVGILFDEDNANFTQSTVLIALSTSSGLAPLSILNGANVFGDVKFLCVEVCGDFLTRKGLGYLSNSTWQFGLQKDYWSGLPEEVFEPCQWEFVRLR